MCELIVRTPFTKANLVLPPAPVCNFDLNLGLFYELLIDGSWPKWIFSEGKLDGGQNRTYRTGFFACFVFRDIKKKILSVSPEKKKRDEFCYQSILCQTTELMYTMMLLTKG